MDNKYPGADTSVKRLVEIEKFLWPGAPPPREFWEKFYAGMNAGTRQTARGCLYDLLAMVLERNADIRELEKQIAIEGGVWDYENDCIKGEK